MCLRKRIKLQSLVLCFAFAQSIAASGALSAEDFVAPSSSEGQRSIQLDPLDSTANYPPVITAIACDRETKTLVAAGDDHALRIVDLESGKTIETLKGHTDWVQAVAVVDPTKQIVSCGNDCTLRLWSSFEPWSSKIIHQGDSALMALAVDSVHQRVACGGFCSKIWIYSVLDGSLVKTLHCEGKDQRAIAFSSDGNQLASGGRDGIVRVWDLESDRLPLEQTLHADRIRSIGFSENDAIITTVGEDRRFVRYQMSTGQVLTDRKIPGGRLLSMTRINPETIAIAGSDNTIRLIEIASGNEINRLVGHDGSVAVMVCSGMQLISGSFDTTIRTWDLSRAMHDKAGKYEHPVSARFQDSGASEAVR